MGDGGSARVGSSPGDYGDYYSWHAAHSRRAVDLGEDRVLHVHYERLQDEPEAVARDIYAFLYPTESSPSREKVDEAVHFASFAVTAARGDGQQKRAKFPTSKAPISAVFHSFRLIFGRAIISRSGLEAWMLFPERARAEHSC